MAKEYRGIKIRIYPNKQQADLIDEFGASARHMWNELLAMQQARYQAFDEMYGNADEETKKIHRKGVYVPKFGMIYLLKPFRKEQGHEWAERAPYKVLQNVCADVDASFQKLFAKQGGFPKFKSWRQRNDSFTFNQGCVALDEHHIKFPKLGVMKYRGYDDLINYKIKAATLRKAKDGYYYASCRVEHKPMAMPKTNKQVGIDLGVKDLAILSNGVKYDKLENTYKHYLWSKHRLIDWQKKYSRRLERAKKTIAMNDQYEKQFGKSLTGQHRLEDFSNLNKARMMLARWHAKVANQRKDYLQKLTTELVKDYDLIVIEDLKASNMMKNHNLARSIAEASFFEFRRELEYKCKWYAKQLVIVAPNYTSQICSDCGFHSGKKTLDIREWDCPNCGVHHDRDINAAKNILNKGLEQLKNEASNKSKKKVAKKRNKKAA